MPIEKHIFRIILQFFLMKHIKKVEDKCELLKHNVESLKNILLV